MPTHLLPFNSADNHHDARNGSDGIAWARGEFVSERPAVRAADFCCARVERALDRMAHPLAEGGSLALQPGGLTPRIRRASQS